MDVTKLSLQELNDGYRSKSFTVDDVVSAYRAVIQERDQDVHAFLEVFDSLDEQIQQAQQRIDKGDAGILTGVPIAVKDNILIEGQTASAASKILENYTATYSATVIEKLRDSGAIFIGRTNMDEFAMGSSTENSAFGVTKNPLDLKRVPGGSSGGSAAAVAMSGAPVALGSDTGGSIRQPASFCGCVGLMPTYGSVSRYGLMALASSLDVIGPIARTVDDVRFVFEAIVGEDSHDSTSVSDGEKTVVSETVKKIGVPRDLLSLPGIAPEVIENFEASLQTLRDAGYTVVDIELPLVVHSLPIYYVIQPAEASSNLARYDGIRYGVRHEGENINDTYIQSRTQGFGAEVKRRILIGTYVLSHGYYDAYYTKATNLRKRISTNLEKILEEVDVIATPTTPTVSFEVGSKTDDPVAMYMSDLFTVPANIAGLPAISIPSGKNEQGLPFGMQFIGPRFGENRLFTVGKDFESRV